MIAAARSKNRIMSLKHLCLGDFLLRKTMFHVKKTMFHAEDGFL
jgi:hypothetical protein